MSRLLINTGSPFEAEIAYSRAVVQETTAGDWCWVAGTTGYDYSKMVMPDDPADQARNALATIGSVLAQSGFEMSDIFRVRYYLTHQALVEEVKPVFAETFRDIRPAATMVIADLMTQEMLVEIEVDAFRAR